MRVILLWLSKGIHPNPRRCGELEHAAYVRETNAVGVFLEEEDGMKLRYLTSA